MWRWIEETVGRPWGTLSTLVTVLLAFTSAMSVAMPSTIRAEGVEFQEAGSGRQGWTPVTLPDLWRQRIPQPPESGLYRFSLDVQPQPGVVYAMRFDPLSDSSGITLNGQLIARR